MSSAQPTIQVHTVLQVCGNVCGGDDGENLDGVDDRRQRRVGGSVDGDVVPGVTPSRVVTVDVGM